MHSLRFHVTGSCLVELQRNKKKNETEEWEFEVNGLPCLFEILILLQSYLSCIIRLQQMKLNTIIIRIITKLNLNLYLKIQFNCREHVLCFYFDNCGTFNQHMQATLKKLIPETIFSISSTRAPHCSSQLYFSL